MHGFDTTVFPKLDLVKPRLFHGKIKDIKAFFLAYPKELEIVRERALMYKEAFDQLDDFIQSYTSKVCPYCGSVCCAQIHGLPEFADIVGILSMDLAVPDYDLSLDRGGVCHFMGEKGCKLPRHQRPYRCTWYFCDPLLVQIEIGPPKQYRSFIKDVEKLARTRGDMLREFYQIWTSKIKVSE